ncbi:MAG: helix-turn-helix transcriptional regulator [Lachnospiraceae bacterium]|nr:helix-turn-helix transcriptional regulator [Lachnospiraceae bacterium]
MDLIYFRQNLREKLQKSKISLNYLSAKADISEDTLRSIIYGKSQDIKLSSILKIAHVLDCSLDSLIGRSVYSIQEENMIKQLRNLSEHSLRTVQVLIDLEEKTSLQHSETGRETLSVFLPTGNMKEGLFYDNSRFESLDITDYPKELKDRIAFGLKITSAHFEPIYFTNDILLLSQHSAPERNDIVLCINEAGRLFLRKLTPFGLDPINRFGKKIPANEMNNYTVLGVVLKVAKEFNIEQYR